LFFKSRSLIHAHLYLPSLPPSLLPSLPPLQGRVAVGNVRFLEEAEGLSLSSTLSSLPTYLPPSLPPSLPESNHTGNGHGGGGRRAGGRKGVRTSVADARRTLEAQGKTVVFVAAEGRYGGRYGGREGSLQGRTE